jgi:hypothetical protein
VRVAIELVLFGVAAAALAAAGQPGAAVVLGVAGVVTSLLNEAQERRAGPEDIQRGRHQAPRGRAGGDR